MNKDVMFSSKSDTWATPQDFFDELDGEFNFTLDPCATPENAKCKKYYTENKGGRILRWMDASQFLGEGRIK